MPECVYVYHVCADDHRGQKRALEPLKLELQAVMSHCVGWGGGRKEKVGEKEVFRLYHQARA